MKQAFVLTCVATSSGARSHYAWVGCGTEKAAEKWVREEFEKFNVRAPGSSGEKLVLEVVLHCGESGDGLEEGQALYEKACKKADKMIAKERGPDPEPTKTEGSKDVHVSP